MDNDNDPSIQKQDEIQIRTEGWNGATKDRDDELLASFNADTNQSNNIISTTVKWSYVVNGSAPVLLYQTDVSTSEGIIEYATPEVTLECESPYAIVNGNEIVVELSIEDDPSLEGKIEREINWGDCIDNRYNGEISAKFNPAEKKANDYTITSEVTWTYTKEGETAPIVLYSKNLDKTETGAAEITVYAEPTYNLDTNIIYNSFVDVEIPIDAFINNIVSNREIIKSHELVVDNKSYEGSYTPDKPEEEKVFQLKAIYKYGETVVLYDKKPKYKINIIDKPEWGTNFKEIFGTNANGEADNYLYTTSELLSKCSKVIEVQQSNNSDVAIGLSGKYSINDYSPTEFTVENSSLKSVPLRDLCSSLNMDQENMIKFSFSYEVQNLLELEGNTDLKCKNETAYIYLCENIDATLPDNPTLEFYTRVGDGKINDLKADQISLTVVGGDPGLWKFELKDDDNENVLLDDDVYVENESVKININYERLNFIDKDAGLKSYSLYAKYVDGITEIGTNESKAVIKINVEPEPELDDLVVGLLGDKGVTYNPVNENDYDIKCYKGDKIKLSSSSNTSSTSYTSSWKYKVGKTAKDITWGDNISFESEDAIGTIEFYSYLKDNSKERLVKTINLQVEYLSTPSVDFNHELRDVGDQVKANKLWDDATQEGNRLDLYAGWENLKLEFMHQNGYDEGWTYNWKLDGNDVSYEKGFDYELKDPTDDAMGYEDKVISFTYTNSIPASNYQDGVNIGIAETKNYYIRVWRKAEMPTKIDDISLKDNQNVNNKVNETMAIREGNDLELSFPKIKYCFVHNNDNEGDVNTYVLKDDKGNSNSIIGVDNTTPRLTHTIKSIENEETNSDFSFGTNTYTLVISNPGPRDIPWEKYEIPVEITVYNRPETPTSLVLKGNGTSGTLIITYDERQDHQFQVPEDYSIVFRYSDKKEICKIPNGGNDRRWITDAENITDNIGEAYAFSRLIYYEEGDKEGHVITSGRILRDAKEGDESWDESRYNVPKSEILELRAITRAGGGDYTAIQSVEPEEEMVSVYNTNGVKVATSTENLKPGIYIIRSMQNGEMNSKKLSVK